MKKIFAFSLIAAAAVTTSANAGWRDMLGLNKTSEPSSLAEACNTDEITSVCPETVLGSKTIMECLSDNISSLSAKCAGYVKKQITAQVDGVAKSVDETKAEVAKTANDVKSEADAVKATAQEVETSAQQTNQNVKETGGWFRNLFK